MLLVWLALVEPLAQRWLAGAVGGDDVTRLAGENAGAGVLLLAAVFCALAAVVTRSPGEAPASLDALSPALYARFPLMAGLGMVAIEATEQLGWAGDDYFFWLIAAITVGSALLYPYLPAMRRFYRRLLMTPITLLGAGSFNALAAMIVGDTGADGFMANLRGPTGPLFILLLFVLLVQYLLFVFAPREVADGGGSVWQWLLRFLLYLAGLLTGRALWPL